MSYFKCEYCGCIMFEQIQPSVFEDSSVRVWGANTLIKSEHTSVTLLKCLKCNKLIVPSTSLLGKNALDIDVQIYKELLKVVEEWNKE